MLPRQNRSLRRWIGQKKYLTEHLDRFCAGGFKAGDPDGWRDDMDLYAGRTTCRGSTGAEGALEAARLHNCRETC